MARRTCKSILAPIRARKFLNGVFAAMALLIFVLPLALTLAYSIEDPYVMNRYIQDTQNALSGLGPPLKIFPQRATLMQYYKLLLQQIAYLRFYLNSVIYAFTITAGQLVVGSMMAFSLTYFKYKGLNLLAFTYVLLFLMPYQVTMVPGFIVLRALGLLDTYAALCLPAIFSPLAVLLLRQDMRTIPGEMLESAKVDGANPLNAFCLIVLPLCKSALCAAGALGFAEAWNMIEQPLILLKRVTLYPLSLALLGNAEIGGAEFAAASLYLIPPLMLFLYFHEDVIQGIQLGELK